MRWLLAGVAVLVAALLTASAAIGWLVGTEDGLHWAASKVPGLRHEGLHGRLAGRISARHLHYAGEGVSVEADELELRAHLAALLGGRLTIDPLRAAAVVVTLDDTPQKGETRLELPLRLSLANAKVDALELRRGAARYRLQALVIEHARLGAELSLAGSASWPHERFPARASVQLRGTPERIEAELAGEVAGVPLEARALVAPSAPQRLRSLEARAGPIDLAGFADAPHTALQAVVRGEPGPGDALSGTLSLQNALAGPLDAERLPFTRLEARFLTDFASARLQGMRITLHGGGAMQGDATLAPGAVHARLAAAAVDLRALHSRLRRTALHGPLELMVDGERQRLRASLTQEGIGLTAEAVRVGERVEVRELRALAEGGEVSGSGRLRLSGALEFSADLAVRHFNPAGFGDYPAGSLSGSLAASGRLEPRQIDLKWALRDSLLYGRSLRSEGAARIVGERVTQAEADVRLGANRLTARGAYGRPGDELALALEAPRLEEFAPLAGALRARGTLSGSLRDPRAVVSAEAQNLKLPGGIELERASARLNGTLAAHDLELGASAPEIAVEAAARLRGGWTGARGWAGELLALTNAGAYPLELGAPAALRLAPQRVELGRLEARVAQGRLLVREAAWSPGRLASSGEFSGLPAQWLIVGAGLGERLSATLRVDGEWRLAHARELDGVVRIRRAAGDLALVGERAVDLGIEQAALEVRFEAGRASGSADVVARIARVALQGSLAPALDVQGKVEFADVATLARPFLQDARVDGRLRAELRATGTLAKPLLHGTLIGEELAFELPEYGVALKEGRLRAVLEGERLTLRTLSARAGDGRITANGVLPLGPDGSAHLEWRAVRLALLDRPDMRLVASGQGEASYDGKRISLRGDLRADRGHFEFQRERLPALGDDVVVLGRPAPPRKGAMRLPLALDLRLDLGDNLVVQGYGYDGKVAGLVDLATTRDGELRAFGRLRAVNATFLAYGQRLDVDPGVLIFDGPIDNPALQITAWRRNQAVEAGVQITGTARAPSVNLVSQPPVPEGERLSWLVLGRPPSGATQADLGLLQAAAGALLAGGDSVPLDRRIARRFGLDELTLRGSGEVSDRVVAIGKRLSDRLYISYEQGLGAVATNLIKLDYALGRRWTLRAETGSSSGGGLFYRYSWD
jgi:translocation and assembly module TamB